MVLACATNAQDRRARSWPDPAAAWYGGGESKTGSQVQVDAHKKEAKCQYKEGRMMVPGHFMTDTGAC